MNNEILVLVMIIGALVSLTIAASKNRNGFGWMFAGAIFPVISVVALLCLPAVEAPAKPSTT